MTIHVACEGCHQAYRVGDDKAGRRFRCKKCDGIIDVPLIEDEFFDIPETTSPAISSSPRPSKVTSRKSNSSGSGFGLQSYIRTFKRFGDTEGRANRVEYWNFTLGNVGIILILATLLVAQGDPGGKAMRPGQIAIAIIYLLFLLAVFAPSISVAVRRLHDTDRSGWWFLVHFVPWVGSLIFIIFSLIPGTPDRNSYGPVPR